jgi:hypothetical protein
LSLEVFSCQHMDNISEIRAVSIKND